MSGATPGGVGLSVRALEHYLAILRKQDDTVEHVCLHQAIHVRIELAHDLSVAALSRRRVWHRDGLTFLMRPTGKAALMRYGACASMLMKMAIGIFCMPSSK
jgi:hypothetical protein